MTFLELAQARFSTRNYKDTPVEKQKVEKILSAGRIAPTAKNDQPQVIYAVTSTEGLEKLDKCTPCRFGAQAALIVCYDKTKSWKRPHDGKEHGDIDAAIVQTHMMLQAEELGLGTVWVCFYDPAAIITEFELPEDIVPSSILMVGYKAEDAQPSDRHSVRKPLEETVRFV
jgi:nitroreductase